MGHGSAGAVAQIITSSFNPTPWNVAQAIREPRPTKGRRRLLCHVAKLLAPYAVTWNLLGFSL